MEQSLIADDGSVRPPDVAEIIAELDERGYCIIPSVISVEKADQVRAILERILADEESEISREKKTQRVARIAVKHPIFVELMSHPLIVAIWRRYLDEDMICSTWTANTTYPGYSRYGWHPHESVARVSHRPEFNGTLRFVLRSALPATRSEYPHPYVPAAPTRRAGSRSHGVRSSLHVPTA